MSTHTPKSLSNEDTGNPKYISEDKESVRDGDVKKKFRRKKKKIEPHRFGWRLFSDTLEALTVVAVILSLGGAFMLWRVSYKPVNLEFAKPYIQSALTNEGSGVNASFDKAILYWPSFKSPLLIGLQNARVKDQNGEVIASVNEAAISISVLGLFKGRVAPSSLFLVNPQVTVERDKFGEISVGFDHKNGKSDAKAEEETQLFEKILSYIAGESTSLFAKTSPLANLKKFKIDNANILVKDKKTDHEWGISGLDIIFKNTSEGLVAAIQSGENDIIIPGMSAAPIVMQELGILANYNRHNKAVDIKNAYATINGMTVTGGAGLAFTKENKMEGQARLNVKTLPQDKVAEIFPLDLSDEPIAEWMTEKLHGGRYKNLDVSTDIALKNVEGGWTLSTDNLRGSFEFEDTTIDYLQRLTPVTHANGEGSFEDKTGDMHIVVSSAKLGELDVSKADLMFFKLISAQTGNADLDISLNGPFAAVLDYVAQERIGGNHGFDTKRVKGTTALDLNLKFPTSPDVRMEEVKLTANGTVNDAFLPNVVNGLDLAEANMKATIKDNFLEASGKGIFDGRSADLTYAQYLYPEGKPFEEKITAKVKGDLLLANKMGADVSDYVGEGSFPADVVYTDYQGSGSSVSLTADITDTNIFFKPFDYDKKRGVSGTLSFNATLVNDSVTKIEGLNITTTDAYLKNATLNFNGKDVTSGIIPDLKIRDSVGKVEFKYDANRTLDISMSGSYLDLRPFLDKDKTESERGAVKLAITAKRLRSHEKEIIKDARIVAYIDAQGRFDLLEVDAIAGQGPVLVRYKPDTTGQRTFRMNAQDAGATLRAFGITDKISGGELQIYGTPNSTISNRDISGTGSLTNFRVRKAPAMAKLISLVSVPGLVSALEGEGLTFTRAEADFNWKYKQGGSLLTLKNGRTSGNALGLTFDGNFDTAASMIDFKGTIIPLSGVNSIIGSIPIVGDIITGGTGSLIAMTYTMRGPAQDPNVMVNPLSALTPGLLRRILFESG